jgi:hypothetical protein
MQAYTVSQSCHKDVMKAACIHYFVYDWTASAQMAYHSSTDTTILHEPFSIVSGSAVLRPCHRKQGGLSSESMGCSKPISMM